MNLTILIVKIEMDINPEYTQNIPRIYPEYTQLYYTTTDILIILYKGLSKHKNNCSVILLHCSGTQIVGIVIVSMCTLFITAERPGKSG